MTGYLIKREKLNTDRHAQREDYLKIHREKCLPVKEGQGVPATTRSEKGRDSP